MQVLEIFKVSPLRATNHYNSLIFPIFLKAYMSTIETMSYLQFTATTKE